MSQISQLMIAFNKSCQDLENHVELAQQTVQLVKPDLTAALDHASDASDVLSELVRLQEEAAELGLNLPVSSVRQVNAHQEQLLQIMYEIAACSHVIKAGNERDVSAQVGRFAPN